MGTARDQFGERYLEEPSTAHPGGGIQDDYDPMAETLPPTPLQDLLIAEQAAIHVLTTDPALFSSTQTAAGEQYPLIRAASFGELVESVRTGSCGIALLDADTTAVPLEQMIAQLTAIGHPLILMVATARIDLADRLRELRGQVHGIILKPSSIDFVRLRLVSAVDQYFEMRNAADTARPAKRRRLRAAFKLRHPLPALAGVVLAVTVGVAWLALRSPAEVAPPVTVTATDVAPVSEIAAVAADVAAETTASEPPGSEPADSDPAADSVADAQAGAPAAETPSGPGPLSAAATEPGDAAPDQISPQIQQLMTKLVDTSETTFAELSEKMDALLALIANLEPETLPFIGAALERRKEPAVAPSTKPPAASPRAARRAAQLNRLLALFAARLEAGQALDPQGDSARDFLQRAQALAPSDRRVRQAREQLIDTLLIYAQGALDAGYVADSSGLLAQAMLLGASSKQVGPLEARLSTARREETARRHASWLGEARALIATGNLLEPAGGNAWYFLDQLRSQNGRYPGLRQATEEFRAALATQLEEMLAASDGSNADQALAILSELGLETGRLAALESELTYLRRQAELLATPAPLTDLKLVSFRAPNYPNRAKRSGIEGWVQLEFVVNETGATEDIQVVAAEPLDIFDSAVVAAVSDYRFEPYQQDGRRYRRAAQTLVRFELTP